VVVTTKALSELIERTTGLALDRGGVSNALGRFVAERMHDLGLKNVEEYITLATNPAENEHRRLIDAITVPHTWFYRDLEQLQTIAKLLVNAPAGRVSVWVAGCATGEEAYTLAMIGRRVGRDLQILATDINERALTAARKGVYNPSSVRDVPEHDRRWFSTENNRFVVDPELRADVNFLRHNLVEPPPLATARGGWDLVVCRNVLIYFAPATVVRVLDRFARSLCNGGSLVVGASEVVFEPPVGLELISAGKRLVLHRPMHGRTEVPPPRQHTMPAPTLGIWKPARGIPTPPMGIPTPALLIPAPATRPLAPTTRPLPPATTPLGPATRPPPPATRPPPPATRPPPPATATPTPGSTPQTRTPAGNPGVPPEPVRAGRAPDLVAALARGHAMFERGEIADAISAYEELVRGYTDVAEVWLFLGIARYVHGDIDAAASALRSSLCLDPALWPAGFYLARAYDRLGRRDAALQQYDLVAVDELQPLALQSSSAVINELRALRHDIRTAAKRVAEDRATSPRRPVK
jgi:chemotaxis protein methyltransferase CheR